MITVNLRDLKLEAMRLAFNRKYLELGDSLLEMSAYELQTAFLNEFSASDWKDFRLHPVVDAWYEEEMNLMIKHKTFALIKQSGSNNSTATTQALNQMLNYLDRKKQVAVEPTIFVYSFVPLSEMEAQAPNVKTLENIPTEIKDSIVKIK